MFPVASSREQLRSGKIARPSRGDAHETTRRLIESAAEEFLAYGYEKAGMSHIARNAGVTVGAIYTRWRDKSEMMADAVDHVLTQLLPEERIKGLDLAKVPLPDILLGWGAALVDSSDPLQDVFVHAFGGAQNDAAVQDRLKHYVNETGDQLDRLVDQSKAEGTCDPDISTAAITLLIEALGIGVRLLLSGGLEDRRIPATEDWVEFVRRLSEAMLPQAEQPQ